MALASLRGNASARRAGVAYSAIKISTTAQIIVLVSMAGRVSILAKACTHVNVLLASPEANVKMRQVIVRPTPAKTGELAWK